MELSEPELCVAQFTPFPPTVTPLPRDVPSGYQLLLPKVSQKEGSRSGPWRPLTAPEDKRVNGFGKEARRVSYRAKRDMDASHLSEDALSTIPA